MNFEQNGSCDQKMLLLKYLLQSLYNFVSTLATHDHEIVCLQEVWNETDQEIIQIACQDHLPYSIVFHG